MKISELKNQPDASIAWGIEIDEEMFDPPANIRTVGLLWEGNSPDAPRDITDRLIDTVIAFSLSGAEVILEVRPEDEVDHAYLLTLAGNAGFSVSAVPPSSEDGVEAWCRQCAGFAEALLTTPNFAKSLFPVSGYVSYLVLEIFSGADAMTPNDPYVVGRFTGATPTEWSDRAKAAMRARMTEMLGGEDGLEEYLAAILRAIRTETRKQCLEMIDDIEAAKRDAAETGE